ncbi:MAG: hypothetical protein HQK53_06915, partial [Oligoflexia bacterium]|nr:hypothetical protein [Oligoflexia bacterium]
MKKFFGALKFSRLFAVLLTIVGLYTVINLSNIQANTKTEFPSPPENCFSVDSYCVRTEVVWKGDQRFIQVTIFAALDEQVYPTKEN